MRSQWWLALAVVFVLVSNRALAEAPATAQAPSQPAATENADERTWSFSASAYTYFIPDDSDYVQPTFAADWRRLHLEARYNYEDYKTGSTWIGCKFSLGEELVLEFTPIAGVVFGATNGIAPGYKGSLSWWKLTLYSEAEYLFDFGKLSDSYFYTWSELTLAPLAWFRFGVVVQRTRVYQSARDIQRGLLVGVSYKALDFAAYLFNPDTPKPSVVLALALTF